MEARHVLLASSFLSAIGVVGFLLHPNVQLHPSYIMIVSALAIPFLASLFNEMF